MICPLCHKAMEGGNEEYTCTTPYCTMLSFFIKTNIYCLTTALDGIYEGKNVYYSKSDFDRLLKLKAFW